MKNIIIKIKENYQLVIGVLIVGIILGWLFFYSSGNKNAQNQQTTESQQQNKDSKTQIWTCSMHPQIKVNHPGKCPICGMDLIPLSAKEPDNNEVDPNALVMTKSAAKLAEIQTTIVKKGIPEKTIYLQGKIQADERNIAELTARFNGRIEKLFVNFTGQNVQKGEKLASIYSPELITAQKELLEAISYKETRPSFYTAARTKLKLWDLDDKQIDAIEQKGEPQLFFTVLSPISGTVTMRHVAIGDYVKEGSALFQVVNLTKVWVLFDAYESDLPWLKVGDKVKFTVPAIPKKFFAGKVSFIDPILNATTRIARVRVEIPNPRLKLKPEMFVNGIIESKIAENTDEILVPKSSVLWTGKRSLVYVKIPNTPTPTFLMREIELGPEAGAFYVIEKGLNVGEEIAVNGVFKIDAAAQLQGLPSMMNPEGGKINTMPGMDMGGGNASAKSSDNKMSDEEMKQMKKTDAETTSYSKNVSEKFKSQIGELVNAYLKMKDGFVATNKAMVIKKAQTVLSALNNVDMTLLKGDAHTDWLKLQKSIKENLNGIINMKGIEMKRSHFSIVSNKIAKAIEEFGINSETKVYLEFCPMAFDNKGAFWISADKKISNPYLGEKMITCGEVKKEY